MSDTFVFNPKIYKEIYQYYSNFMRFRNEDRQREDWREIPYLQPLSKKQFQELLKIALWSSLKQEEGRFHKFSLCVIPQEDCLRPFVFDEPIPLDETHLTKISPAFDLSANFIGIWHGKNKALQIWGFASTQESKSVELFCEVIAPGQILISLKQYGIHHLTFFISGIETKFVGTSEFSSWVIPGYDKSKRSLDYDLPTLLVSGDYRQIVTAMRSHQHGGTLLVVREENDWKNSIREPITNSGYGYSGIRENIFSRNKILREQNQLDLNEKLTLSLKNPELDAAFETTDKSLKVIGNLTAIDGATVIKSNFDILAFGVKIEAKTKPKKVLIISPFENDKNKESKPKLSDLGGTRHQSAAQFVFEQKTAMAFVVSQDGRISVMRWDEERKSVCVIRPAEFALL
jgi:hypothetical protein